MFNSPILEGRLAESAKAMLLNRVEGGVKMKICGEGRSPDPKMRRTAIKPTSMNSIAP